jgi:hypothetical protein
MKAASTGQISANHVACLFWTAIFSTRFFLQNCLSETSEKRDIT